MIAISTKTISLALKFQPASLPSLVVSITHFACSRDVILSWRFFCFWSIIFIRLWSLYLLNSFSRRELFCITLYCIDSCSSLILRESMQSGHFSNDRACAEELVSGATQPDSSCDKVWAKARLPLSHIFLRQCPLTHSQTPPLLLVRHSKDIELNEVKTFHNVQIRAYLGLLNPSFFLHHEPVTVEARCRLLSSLHRRSPTIEWNY